MYSAEPISHDSIDEIIPLLLRLYPSIGKDVITSRLQEVSKSDWECLVLRESDGIIGLSGFRIMDRICYGKFLYIDHFIIDENRQSSGAAKFLLDRIVDISESMKCESVILDTFVTNSRAQHFWMKGGFKIVGFHFQKTLF